MTEKLWRNDKSGPKKGRKRSNKLTAPSGTPNAQRDVPAEKLCIFLHFYSILSRFQTSPSVPLLVPRASIAIAPSLFFMFLLYSFPILPRTRSSTRSKTNERHSSASPVRQFVRNFCLLLPRGMIIRSKNTFLFPAQLNLSNICFFGLGISTNNLYDFLRFVCRYLSSIFTSCGQMWSDV